MGLTSPEELYGAIESTQTARIVTYVQQAPFKSGLALLLTGILLPLIGLGEIGEPERLFWTGHTPSVGVICLLVGWMFFPLRFFWLPLGIYALSVGMGLAIQIAELWLVRRDLDDVVFFMLGSSLLNAVIAFPAVLCGRRFHRAFTSIGDRLRADIGLIFVTIIAFAVVAPVLNTCLVQAALSGDPTVGTFAETLAVVTVQVVRLLAGSGLFFLVLLEPLGRHLRPSMLVAALLAVILSALSRAGFVFHGTLDPLFPLLLLALVARPQVSAVIAIETLAIYEMVTGAFSASFNDPGGFDYEVISAFATLFLTLLVGARYWSLTDLHRSQSAIERLRKAHVFAKVGYFVVDPDKRIAHMDTIGAEILGTTPVFDVNPFIARVAPDDLPAVIDALSDTEAVSKQFSFCLDTGASWQPDGEKRFVTVYVWYETIPGRGRVAYGAILNLTEESKRETDLKNAVDALSRHQEKQTQLFSIVSHELRTPASIIVLLLDEMDSSGDWSSVSPKLRAVTEQLLSVLSDMRQAVRPEQNLPVELQIVEPQAKLERLRNSFLLLAERSGFTIDIEPVTTPVKRLMTDRTRVTQSLSNLVKNAIVHSHGTKITLSFRTEVQANGEAFGIWSVADNGRGIPAHAREKIFEPFTRLKGGSEKVDGSGLGLFVVKSAVELLGGQVRCDEREGGGTRFDLCIPLLSVDETAPAEAERKSGDAGADGTLGSFSVLIAEDNPIMAELMQAKLGKVFARVTITANGNEALRVMQDNPHDIVLTDLFMPELGGDGLTRELRSKGFSGPIIGMTAADIGEERRSFEIAGTNGVMTKPVSVPDFVSLIESVLAA